MPIVLQSLSTSGAVGIANYGDLKAQVALWLNRTDLEEAIPEFVRIAESRIRTDIKVRTQEQLTSGTLTGETLAVPSQMTEARRLVVDQRELYYITPEQYQKLDRLNVARPSRYYTIIGENFYIAGGLSGDTYSLLYWEWFDYFSADTDTNWLLLNSPDVYLWGSCQAGALYLKDYEAANDFGGRYAQAVKRVEDREKDMRYSGGPMYVRPDVRE